MKILSLMQKYFRKFGLMAPLGFDKQVWGAKALMDLYQPNSTLYLAETNAGGTMYTCWNGYHDNKPYAITVDPTGHTTGPVYDSSRIGDCEAWQYPCKINCQQAQQAMIKAGITDAWTFCRLRKTVDSPQANPFYDFTFASRQPVRVDAVTGQVTQTK
jgi:hypothetical protein